MDFCTADRGFDSRIQQIFVRPIQIVVPGQAVGVSGFYVSKRYLGYALQVWGNVE